jgi:hypothetical protein
MRVYLKIGSRLREILAYLIALILLLDSRTIYGFLTNTPRWWNYLIFAGIGMCVAAVLIILLFRVIHLDKSSQQQLIFCAIIAVYFSIFVLYHDAKSYTMKLLLAFLLLAIYHIVAEKGKPDILMKFRNIVVVIAAISLLFWISGSIMHIIKPSGTVLSIWSGTAAPKAVNCYKYLYFETQEMTVPFLHINTYRNTAVFSEAPMAAFNFSIALLTEIYINPKKRKSVIIILSSAIITTISTTGICVLLLIIIHHISKNFSKKKSPLFLILIPIILGVLALGMILVVVLVKDKVSSNSGIARLDDFRVCFLAWLHHPLMGCGLGNGEYIQSFMSLSRLVNNKGLSNSPGLVLAEGGLYLSILYIIAFSRMLIRSHRSKIKNYYIWALFFILIFTITMVPFVYLTFYILVWFAFGDITKENWKLSLFQKKSTERLIDIG